MALDCESGDRSGNRTQRRAEAARPDGFAARGEPSSRCRPSVLSRELQPRRQPPRLNGRVYLIETITNSTGLPPVFFDSCAAPRPMKRVSPSFHSVVAFPSTVSEKVPVPSAITTWS